jgi:hypothetical protein
MADAGWGQGRPDSGILQVLIAFVMQGGQLAAARRRPDNPLTLTHLLWQGPEGASLEAVRLPNSERESPEEREVWVQLALHLQATPVPFPYMPNESPWMPLVVDRELVSQWVRVLRHGQMNRPSNSPPPLYGGGTSLPPSGGQDMRGRNMQPESAPPHSELPSRPRTEGAPPHHAWPPSSLPSGTPPAPPLPPFTPPGRPPSQRTGSWDRSSADTGEVTVLPCVEVELPPVMNNPAAADYRRDFARDVALHFGRAARTIPQVREVRGWMRGDRLVLAARFVVAIGNRAPMRADMDGAARILADVLAQRTLPYVQLGFADPGEWMQGAPLPE